MCFPSEQKQFKLIKTNSPLVYHVGLEKYDGGAAGYKEKEVRNAHIKMEYLHTICTEHVRCQKVNMLGKLQIPSCFFFFPIKWNDSLCPF